MNQRPVGVTLIAIIFIGLGILSLLWSGLVFGVGGLSSLFGSLFNAENMAAFGTSSTWMGFLGILAAASADCGWLWPAGAQEMGLDPRPDQHRGEHCAGSGGYVQQWFVHFPVRGLRPADSDRHADLPIAP